MPSGFGWHFLFVLFCDSGKCLLEIVEDVIDMLQTNRQAHKTRRDAAGNQLLITELAVGCRCRMQDAAVNVCDMNLQRNHLQAVDKLVRFLLLPLMLKVKMEAPPLGKYFSYRAWSG